MSALARNDNELPMTEFYARQFSTAKRQNLLAALGVLGGLIDDPFPFESVAKAIRARQNLDILSHWQPSHARVIRDVAEKARITHAELVGPCRKVRFARPRQEAMYRLRHELRLSYPRIGQLLGGRDHTTILHGVRVHAARLLKEPI